MHARNADGSLAAMDFELPSQPEVHMGGHGLYSTVGDYMRFIRMWLNDGAGEHGPVLKAETVQLAEKNHLGDKKVTMLPGVIDDAADRFVGEQLETGWMHPGQHDCGNAGVDPWDAGGGEVLDEVRVSARDPIGPDVRICAGHVANVGEPLITQEIVEDVNRRKASVVLPVQEPHRGRLRRSFFRHGFACVDERRSAGKARGRDGKAGLEEMTSVLHVRVSLCLEKANLSRRVQSRPSRAVTERKKMLLHRNDQYCPVGSSTHCARRWARALASRYPKA
jgi:hypothetical protein